MKNKNIFYILIIVIFLVIMFFLIEKKNVVAPISEIKTVENTFNSKNLFNLSINDIKYVKIAGKMLKVNLALTGEAQEQGLSGRKSLKENEGMLFVFNQTGKYSFWMKDMNFSLDIIWISEDFHVVYIKNNASPESYPESFTPKQDAKYVLEVMSSFSQKNNLKVGDKVEFLSS